MAKTTAPPLPDTPAELLRAVRASRDRAAAEDMELMRLAVHWADLHLADPEFAEACFTSPKTFAGAGSPSSMSSVCRSSRRCWAAPVTGRGGS